MKEKGQIFILQDENTLLEVQEQSYDSENLLQSLLSKYPKLLAGDQINSNSPRQWLLISREAPIPSEEEGSGRWSVDHLFVDQDGIPTLVEVKRSSDTRIRREVVGQMLEYAANATLYWPKDSIKTLYEETCRQNKKDADENLYIFLGNEANAEEFWERVGENLEEGKLRLLFVADHIPDELKHIVEFLNEQMEETEVLAIEVSQYVGQNIKTLVSRVIGLTSKAQQKKTPSIKWDEELFFKEATNNLSGHVSILRDIYNWAIEKDLKVTWGRGKNVGSFTVRATSPEESLYSVLSIFTDGGGQIPFGEIIKAHSEDNLKKGYESLIAIKGIDLKNYTKWPTFSAKNLDKITVIEFLKIIESFL